MARTMVPHQAAVTRYEVNASEVIKVMKLKGTI